MKKLFTLFMLLAGMSVHAQQGYWNGDEFVKLTPDEAILYKYVHVAIINLKAFETVAK